MAYLPRGIEPDLLVSQVKNTMPYLFFDKIGEGGASFVPAQTVRAFAVSQPHELSHFEYFRLCASAHYLTCGTPVPTDVDNQIRFKLWPKDLPLEVALEMADFVIASHDFDFRIVTTRFTYGAKGTPFEHEPLSGHLGEWFTLACGAYCRLKQYKSEIAEAKSLDIFDAIQREVHRHSEIFSSLWKAQDGIGCLKASALIAHNFGDLDRVMDMWDLSVGDPLRLEFFKLCSQPFDQNRNLRHLGRLWVAGELYKSLINFGFYTSSMAFENHRHFALRKPKILREKREFLIPTGPFFDEWGVQVARHMDSEENLVEVIEALLHGWERLPQTVGYGRALNGILSIKPHLRSEINFSEIPRVKVGEQIVKMSQAAFEKSWASQALELMEDIPSRA
jgi:hypothetical protein